MKKNAKIIVSGICGFLLANSILWCGLNAAMVSTDNIKTDFDAAEKLSLDSGASGNKKIQDWIFDGNGTGGFGVGARRSIETGATVSPVRLDLTGSSSVRAVAPKAKPAVKRPPPQLATGKFYDWEFGSRIADVGRSLFNIGKGAFDNLSSMVIDVPVGLVSDLSSAAGRLAEKDFSGAARGVGAAVANAVMRGVGGGVDTLAGTLHGVVDIADTISGKPLPRALTADERKRLSEVYGDSVNLDSVRIRAGSSTHKFLPSHAMYNTIYLAPDYFVKENAWKTDQTLVHETAHVWQGQHGGNDYIHNSLFANGAAIISGGDRNGAYVWRTGSLSAPAQAFRDLNAEQQAMVIQDYNSGVFLYTQERAYAQKAMELVRAGQGAP